MARRAIERAHRRQSVTVVWTGPESRVTSSRLTAATVVDLISQAHAEILLVSFATQTDQLISEALHEASARGVAITLLAERHADNPSYTAPARPSLDWKHFAFTGLRSNASPALPFTPRSSSSTAGSHSSAART